MNLHEFCLIPSAGHMGNGTYWRGAEDKNLTELDLVDRYLLPLKDELDQCGIRFSVAPTRSAPGMTEEERYNVFDHVMPVMCAIGSYQTVKSNAKKGQTVRIRPAHNSSAVYYGAEVPRKLYELVSEAVGHWGGLYVHGHKTAAPIEHLGRGLILEPFIIDGPSAIEYAAKLDRLGRDIGRAIADYCRQNSAGAAFSVNKSPPKKARAL